MIDNEEEQVVVDNDEQAAVIDNEEEEDFINQRFIRYCFID